MSALCLKIKEEHKLVTKDAKHAVVMDAQKRILLAEDKILSTNQEISRKELAENKNNFHNFKQEMDVAENV